MRSGDAPAVSERRVELNRFMGTEYVLLARELKLRLGLGKTVHPRKGEPLQLQGTYIDTDELSRWCTKEESWMAVQQFLMDTLGSTLMLV